MPTANQPNAGILAATLAVMGGLVWAATRNVRAGAERRETLAELRALRPMLAAKLAEVREAGYSGGYLDGLNRSEPDSGPERRLRSV